MATDILVATKNPTALDAIVRQFHAAVVEETPGVYLQAEGGYVVRCFGDAEFLEFMIANQGYGTVLKRESELR